MSSKYRADAENSTVSPLDRQFPFTIIPDLSGSTMGVEVMSLRELAAKAKATRRKAKKMLPLFNGAAFGNAASAKGSLRHDANVTTVAAVVVDYDGGTITVEEARATLKAAGLTGLVMTSPTSGEPGRGHRWRGVLPLSRPHDRAAYEALAEQVNGLFGGVLDKGSREPSRSYFLGHTGKIAAHLVEGGRWLDEADLPRRAWTKTERVEGDAAEAWGRPLHVLRSALVAIPNDGERGPDRDGWLKIGAAVHLETGGSDEGFDLFDDWSALWPDHDTDAARKVWESFGRDRGRKATGRHIRALAEAEGWIDVEERDRLYNLFDMVADLDELVGYPSAAPKRQGRLTFESPDDCASAKASPYIIKGLLHEGDIACIYGQPNHGKSIVAPYLGYRVSLGEPAFGMRVRQGSTFYVAAEGAGGMRKRVSALRRRYGDAAGFRLVTGLSNLMPQNGKRSLDHAELLAAIERERPRVVIIDTIARAFVGLEENSSEGMGQVLHVAQSLTKWGAAVILIHHPTKSGEHLRGFGGLHGALDMELLVEKDADLITATAVKARDFADGGRLVFGKSVEVLGQDDDGDDITTVVCVERQGAPEPRQRRPKKSADEALTVLMALMEGRESVPEEEWRKACVDGRKVSQAEVTESRRMAFRRAVGELVRGDWVAFHEGAYSLRAIAEGDSTFTDGEDDALV